jgi:hypothetical protein
VVGVQSILKRAEDGMSFPSNSVAFSVRLTLLALVLSFVACNDSRKTEATVFSSPDAAGTGLLEAAKSGNLNAVLAIFGPESKATIFSGDAVQDRATVDAFVAAYGTMHRWRKMPDQAQILLIGADNFAFPIPLKKKGENQWFFDAVAGKDEILARRIGRNELAVIDVCGALVDAQAEYYTLRHDDGSTNQYALKFISDSGKQNGLYWEVSEGQPKSPLGPLVAFATGEGYSVRPNSSAPFHGYNFHMLTKQGSHAPGGAKDYVADGKMAGGFAFVAYPAEYGNSGVMTFIIDQDGVLLQKDLGKNTKETVTAMNEFNPDSTWSEVVE